MIKQAIVMRTKYPNGGLRKGKYIAQGCHASTKFLTDIILNKEKLTSVQLEWMTSSFRKICLQVDSEEQLLEIHNAAIAANLVSHLITDSGLTEFGGIPTITCCAIGPDYDDKIDAITGSLKLY